MKGQVVAINRPRGMFAVEIDRNDHSIGELLDGEVEIGDEVSWPQDMPLGHVIIRNDTHGVNIGVFFQNHSVPNSQVRQQLLYAQ